MISTRKPDFAEPGQGLSEEEVQRSSLFCKKNCQYFVTLVLFCLFLPLPQKWFAINATQCVNG